MDKEQIWAEIAQIKEEMKEVHGTRCEVYSRVVGYLRPVQGWNKGKKEEFKLRKTMIVENPTCDCRH